jgi:NAD-dependent SIR2 family protein deacetylase
VSSLLASDDSLMRSAVLFHNMPIVRAAFRDAQVAGTTSVVAFVREALARAQKIVFVVGAGLSTSAGVTDFRSMGGLFEKIEPIIAAPPLDAFGLEPRDVFCGETLREFPEVFWRCAHLFMPSLEARPLPTRGHAVIKALADRGSLAAVISMNIDGLEEVAGIPRDLIHQVHGDSRVIVCSRCKARSSVFDDKIAQAMSMRAIPTCGVLRGSKGRACGAVLVPDIVFYNQKTRLRKRDVAEVLRADLVIVVGTSLDVEPVSSLHTLANAQALRIFINRHSVPKAETTMDACLLGDADDILEALLADFDGDGTAWVADGSAARLVSAAQRESGGGAGADLRAAKRSRVESRSADSGADSEPPPPKSQLTLAPLAVTAAAPPPPPPAPPPAPRRWPGARGRLFDIIGTPQ